MGGYVLQPIEGEGKTALQFSDSYLNKQKDN